MNHISDLQAIENNYITNLEHSELGRVNVVGFPFGMSETSCGVSNRATALSEHTEGTLNDICGYSTAEIEKLRRENVI